MKELRNNLQLRAMLITAIILGAVFTVQILINGFKPF